MSINFTQFLNKNNLSNKPRTETLSKHKFDLRRQRALEFHCLTSGILSSIRSFCSFNVELCWIIGQVSSWAQSPWIQFPEAAKPPSSPTSPNKGKGVNGGWVSSSAGLQACKSDRVVENGLDYVTSLQLWKYIPSDFTAHISFQQFAQMLYCTILLLLYHSSLAVLFFSYFTVLLLLYCSSLAPPLLQRQSRHSEAS